MYINEQSILPDTEEPNGTGRLLARNLATGNIAWDNTDYTGASSSWVYGYDGTIYVCGYYGPNCIAIDNTGNTL